MTDTTLLSEQAFENKVKFAPYLNLARQNAYLIFEDISNRLELEVAPLKEAELHEAKLIKVLRAETKNPDLQKRVVKLLAKHLPWLEELRENLETDSARKRYNVEKALADMLTNTLKRLNSERNIKSHYYHDEQKNITILNLFSPLYRSAKKAVLDNKFNGVGEDALKTVEINFTKDNNELTQDGLIFFTCLFLEKKDSLAFINQFEGYRLNEHNYLTEEELRAYWYTFIYHNAKLPQPKLTSGELHLDMLGELMRVPNQVFQKLSPEQREAFVTNDTLEVEVGEQNIIAQQTVMKRSDDRFPYFALTWLEKIEAFKSLRFHLHLGKLLVKSYPKKINGAEQTRNIFRDIRTFDLLSKYPRETEADENLIANRLEQYAPKYQMPTELIGLKFTQTESPDFALLQRKGIGSAHLFEPDALLNTRELADLCYYQFLFEKHKEAINQENEKREKENAEALKNGAENYQEQTLIKAPEWYIYDFLVRLHRFYEKVIQDKIPLYEVNEEEAKIAQDNREAVMNTRAKVYAPTLEKHGIKLNYLTDNLRRYLLAAPLARSVKQTAERKLNERIEDTERRLKGLEKFFDQRKKDKNFRNKLLTEQLQAFNLPKVGELATWLAKDMTFFQAFAEQGRHKPNNQQYNTLQSGLALFSAYKRDDMSAYWRELKMTEPAGSSKVPKHPFLSKVNLQKCSFITDIYKQYLNARKEWLEARKKRIEEQKDEQLIFTENKDILILKRRPEHDPMQSIKAKVSRYKENPVMLPRGLFTDAIREILGLTETTTAFSDSDNAVFMLREVLSGLKPAYYDYDRTYEHRGRTFKSVTLSPEPVLIRPPRQTEGKNDVQRLLTEKKAIKVNLIPEIPKDSVEHDKTEKQVLFEQRQIQLMQIKWFPKIAKAERNINALEHKDRVLWLMIKKLAEGNADIEKAYNLEKSNLRNIGFDAKESQEEKPELSVQLAGKKVTARMHLRQYGRFRRFMKDRRLPNLFTYFNEEQIPLQTIENEIKVYDVQRRKLTKVVLEFEKLMWVKFGTSLTQKKGTANHLKHSIILQIARGRLQIKDEDLQLSFGLLQLIRNSFNHNDFFALEKPVEKQNAEDKKNAKIWQPLKEQVLRQRANFVENKAKERKAYEAQTEQEKYHIKPAIAEFFVNLAVRDYEQLCAKIKSN